MCTFNQNRNLLIFAIFIHTLIKQLIRFLNQAFLQIFFSLYQNYDKEQTKIISKYPSIPPLHKILHTINDLLNNTKRKIQMILMKNSKQNFIKNN